MCPYAVFDALSDKTATSWKKRHSISQVWPNLLTGSVQSKWFTYMLFVNDGDWEWAVSYPGLWYEAAHWLWNWCTRQSLAQVTRCRRGPRISLGWWASLAADEYALVEKLEKLFIKKTALFLFWILWVATVYFPLQWCSNTVADNVPLRVWYQKILDIFCTTQ